jgi:hypothetical protein
MSPGCTFIFISTGGVCPWVDGSSNLILSRGQTKARGFFVFKGRE